MTLGRSLAKPKFSKFQSLVLVAALGVFLSLTSQAAPAQNLCCANARTCQQLVDSVANRADLQNHLGLLNDFKESPWTIAQPNLEKLSLSQKDYAGTYQVVSDPRSGALAFINSWKAGDAEGITKDGQSRIAIRRICLASDRVQFSVTVRYGFFTRDLEFGFTPQKSMIDGLNRRAEGYKLSVLGYGDFVFYRP